MFVFAFRFHCRLVGPEVGVALFGKLAGDPRRLDQKQCVVAVVRPERRAERQAGNVADGRAADRHQFVAQADHGQHRCGAADQVGLDDQPLALAGGVDAVLRSQAGLDFLADPQAQLVHRIARLAQIQGVGNDRQGDDAEPELRIVGPDHFRQVGQCAGEKRQPGRLVDPVALAGDESFGRHLRPDKTRRDRSRRRWPAGRAGCGRLRRSAWLAPSSGRG